VTPIFLPSPSKLNTNSLQYLPGQWLDVYIPGVPRAGGFTLTSCPPLASRSLAPALSSFSSPYLELAIQNSPNNPPAAWLWQDQELILGQELNVRVGGIFVWPPNLLLGGRLKKVVFVAGGVGINPIMSILSSIATMKESTAGLRLGFEVRLLYTTRIPPSVEEILFLQRLKKVFEYLQLDGHLQLFLTSRDHTNDTDYLPDIGPDTLNMSLHRRRINGQDLEEALGNPTKRSGTVCYVCGVPVMTDEFVEKVKSAEGMEEDNVLFEKWW